MKRHFLLSAAVAAACLFGAASVHADELDDIMTSGEIKISTDVAIPPAGMMDAQMHPIGSDVETAELLAKDWNLKLAWIPTTGATRIPNALSGKANVIISTLSVTPDRAKVIDFSRAYTILQSIVGGDRDIKLSTLEGLKGMSVAVTRGTTQDTKLTGLASQYGFNVVRYDDDATLVTAGATGQSKLIATSVALVRAVDNKNPAANFEPKLVLDNFDIAIGVKKGEPRLLAKLNDWILANLKNGKLNEIYKKYYNVDLPDSMRPPLVN